MLENGILENKREIEELLFGFCNRLGLCYEVHKDILLSLVLNSYEDNYEPITDDKLFEVVKTYYKLLD